MNQILKNILVATGSAVIGGVIAISAVKFSPTLQSKISGAESRRQQQEFAYDDIYRKQEDIQPQFDSFFNDDFFSQNDPFEEMKRMRKQIERHMQNFVDKNSDIRNPFDTWFSNKFGGGTVNDISKREDDEYVYYDIRVDDLNSASINTKIENGYITISGTVEKKSKSSEQEGSVESVLKSSFNRTFPLPENVDQNKMEMVPEKDTVILKFPKTKS